MRSRRLPLFPLDLVLFPGARVPLHIFEPRYRALLSDVLASGGEFGIVPPGDQGAPPATGAIGCTARVLTAQPVGDGRFNALVEGGPRIVVRRILDEATPYLQALVDEFGDEEGADGVPSDSLTALKGFAERCRAAMAALTDSPLDEPWSDDPATLTFQVASTIPWEPHQARPVLAFRSAAQRADLLLRILPQLVPDLEKRAAVHRRAGSNGKGSHPPDE